LTPYGRDFGLISETDYRFFEEKQERIREVMAFLQKCRIRDNKDTIKLKDWLKKPEVRIQDVLEYGKYAGILNDEEMRFVESEVKYEGYLKKQEKDLARIRKTEKMMIPRELRFGDVPGLTREAVEKLEKFSPKTVGEAKKIPGITPAAILNICLFVEVLKRRAASKYVSRETPADDE
jgi:tRNA uridine 5-carboxymethylaminomethyl modification enzyme